MIIPQGTDLLVQLVSLNKVLSVSYVTDSPLSSTNIAQLASLYDYPLGDGLVSPTGQFKQGLDSFYDTDCPLSVSNIQKLATFYLN